jgi:TonB family protein
LVWFHPAIWWLVARIRLSREQAVDRQVLLLTRSREPYVNALLTMSGARPSPDLAPAPLFLRRRHLVARITSIVKEASMSKRRLISSYLSIGATLAVATWIAVMVFPLRGHPQVRTEETTSQRTVQAVPKGAVLSDSPGITVDPGGTILHRAGVMYPPDAARAGVAGTVVLELSLDASGNVVDARVVSGPEQLRRTALQSALQWHYEATGAKTVQASIDFRKSTVTQHPTAGTEAVPPRPVPDMASWTLRVDLSHLPQSQQDTLRPRLAPLEGRPLTPELHNEAASIVREVEPHATGMRISGDPVSRVQTVTLFVPGDPRSAGVPGGVGSGVPGGVSAGVAGTTSMPELPPPPEGTARIRVGGNVQAAKLTNKVDPVYPPLAYHARIQGVVRFTVLIDTEGQPKHLQLISGHPLLVQSATEALRLYRWQSTLLNGNKAEVVAQVDVSFTLEQ